MKGEARRGEAMWRSAAARFKRPTGGSTDMDMCVRVQVTQEVLLTVAPGGITNA